METTLSFVKHSGLQRGLVGQIINRFEQKGLQLVGMKMIWMDNKMASMHYQEHVGKGFYDELIRTIIAGPIVIMAWRGVDAIKMVRNMMGGTNPLEAALGTIRGDWGHFIGDNIVHGSDSPESAERELKLFFKPEELHEYDLTISKWLGYDG